jgi:hypothetical protein
MRNRHAWNREEVKMRGISLVLLGAMIGSCTTTAPVPTRTAQRERQYEQLIAGKVAGPAQACIPTITSHSNDMVIIDDRTVAFKAAGGRVYVNHLGPGCDNIGMGNSLVTRQSAASSLCRGDIAQVQNLTAGITVGSCTFGDFRPYSPGGA